MLTELTSMQMKELDMKAEISPQMAMELIAALSQQELSDKAIRYLHEALIQARTLQYLYYQLIIINNLSTAYGTIGETSKAETLLEQGLQVAEEMGLQRQIVLILFNLGNLKLSNNQDEAAIAYYRRCVSILESMPHAAFSSRIHASNQPPTKGDKHDTAC